jgi:hypothetical protein
MAEFRDFFGGAFDPSSVEPEKEFECIPPGKYAVMFEAAECRENKAQTGHYVWIEMTIADGPLKGRKVWDRVNFDNPNAVCVEIGRRRLSAICEAVELPALDSPDDLLNRWCYVSIKVKNEQNEIGAYHNVKSDVIQKFLAQPQQQSATTTTQGPPTQPPPAQPQGAPTQGPPPAPADQAAAPGSPTQRAEAAQVAPAQPTPAQVAPAQAAPAQAAPAQTQQAGAPPWQ